MGEILDFLYTNRNGIIVLFLILFALGLLIHYLMWVFGKGRFGGEIIKTRQPINFVVAEAAIKIVNDFRHLLALLLVVVFACALGYALYTGHDNSSGEAAVKNLKESLQAVMATLGGLVGSIIGYYFGESSRAGGINQSNSPITPPSPQQNPPTQNPPGTSGTGATPIQPAPPPPGVTPTGTGV